MEDKELLSLVKSLDAELSSSDGRLIVRASGTEPKIRVMAEAESLALCEKCIKTILSFLREKGYLDEK
jgi:phosphoglucosamine mutase